MTKDIDKQDRVIIMVSSLIDQVNELNKQLSAIRKEKAGIKARGSRRRKSLVGMRFGSLVVTSMAPDYVGSDNRVRIRWNCDCDCGETTVAIGSNLTTGGTKSCGCAQKICHTTHGHTAGGSRSPTFSSWNAMKTRCTVESHTNYPAYGGKGIRVCERWMKFAGFLEDMGERPSDDHQLHRLDGKKGYKPGNVVWIHKDEHPRRGKGRKND